jgi:hypothetical protein
VNVLRAIEQKIEGLFEGLFGRAFRTNVQPVELARKLVKEMEDHRTVSVSACLRPERVHVYLSPPTASSSPTTRARCRPSSRSTSAEHARREGTCCSTPPTVAFETDDDLAIGEFGIATRMVQGRRRRSRKRPHGHVESGATMIYKPRTPLTEEARPPTSRSRRRSSR